MREILVSAITLSALAALLSLVTYKEDDRVFRAAVYTVIFSLLLSPICDTISSLDPLFELGGAAQGGDAVEFNMAIRESYEEAIAGLIADRIGHEWSLVEVAALDFSTTEITCRELIVTLKGAAIYSDVDMIRRLIKEELLINEIRIKFG